MCSKRRQKIQNALALYFEERDAHEPPLRALLREKVEARRRELHETLRRVRDRHLRGQHLHGRRLVRSDELPEKAALRQQLMLEYVADVRRARV